MMICGLGVVGLGSWGLWVFQSATSVKSHIQLCLPYLTSNYCKNARATQPTGLRCAVIA